MYFMYCNVYEFTMHWASCEWWDVCGTYVYVPHATPHTLMQLHMSVWYSVTDVLHSTPGVMRVHWRHYTRILLCVT